ncbi:hypothetical protein [Alphaproteobacteria bacterium endosymbiont of Tiliacea citrago]|uniref:hypothetical protein n=1 Tax=Alphaproteobacteria bacterium endosymbiont of Tiliacea citrago TaxID=3077944 RepID=UPI00313A7BA4
MKKSVFLLLLGCLNSPPKSDAVSLDSSDSNSSDNYPATLTCRFSERESDVGFLTTFYADPNMVGGKKATAPSDVTSVDMAVSEGKKTSSGFPSCVETSDGNSYINLASYKKPAFNLEEVERACNAGLVRGAFNMLDNWVHYENERLENTYPQYGEYMKAQRASKVASSTVASSIKRKSSMKKSAIDQSHIQEFLNYIRSTFVYFEKELQKNSGSTQVNVGVKAEKESLEKKLEEKLERLEKEFQKNGGLTQVNSELKAENERLKEEFKAEKESLDERIEDLLKITKLAIEQRDAVSKYYLCKMQK